MFFLDEKQVRQSICLVSYGFDDKVKPHSVVPRSHGNSKGDEAYIRTMKSTKEKLRVNSKKSNKGVMMEVVENVGGVMNSRSVGALPKNSQQVAYYKSKEKAFTVQLNYNFTIPRVITHVSTSVYAWFHCHGHRGPRLLTRLTS